MKNQIFIGALILGILLSLNFCYGQEKRYPFEEISLNCECPDFEWKNMHRELKNISQSANDLEIRLDMHAKWHNRTTTLITRNKGKYEGAYYHKRTESFLTLEKDSLIKYKGKWEKYNFKKFKLEHVNLDSIVEVLLSQQIKTLPNQNEIYNKGFMTPFTISYKIDGEMRSFHFGHPDDPMREYPDEPVYRHYDAILKTFFAITDPMYRQIWNDIKLQNEKEQRDTIFLRKPNSDGHSVYIDKAGRASPYFTILKNLDYTYADEQYNLDIKALWKFRKPALKPVNLGKLPRNWVPLHMYKGKYYVYSPSNRTQLKISLNDSTLISKGMERSLDIIDNVHQKGENVYEVMTTDYQGQIRLFKIHLIDKYRGIAVFE
ncbi:MAG: hypothetical protein EOO43_06245, partial [Flavobacterium sp.]